MDTKQYRLLRDVTDGGILRPAGSTIEYDDVTAQWAAQNGLIGPSVLRPGRVAAPAPASTLPNGGVEDAPHRVYEAKQDE